MPVVRSATPLDNEAPLLEALSAIRQLGRELNRHASADATGGVSLRLIAEHVVQWLSGASAYITLGDPVCSELDPAAHIPSDTLSGPCPGESMRFPLEVAGERVGVLFLRLSDARPF